MFSAPMFADSFEGLLSISNSSDGLIGGSAARGGSGLLFAVAQS